MLTQVKIVTQSGLEVVPKQYRQVSQAGQIDVICANFVVHGEICMLREEIDHSGCSEEESELDGRSSDSGTKLLKLPSSQIDYTFLQATNTPLLGLWVLRVNKSNPDNFLVGFSQQSFFH